MYVRKRQCAPAQYLQVLFTVGAKKYAESASKNQAWLPLTFGNKESRPLRSNLPIWIGWTLDQTELRCTIKCAHNNVRANRNDPYLRWLRCAVIQERWRRKMGNKNPSIRASGGTKGRTDGIWSRAARFKI